MGFKRFLTWLVEKLVELHLGIAALLLVKFFVPVTPQAYQSLGGFVRGVRETYAAAYDDASYVAGNFLGGPADYALNTYLGSAYVIGFYFYLSSLYILLSLLALGLSRGHYLRNALLAFIVSFGLFCLRFIHVYDSTNIYAGIALFGLGAVIVLISAGLGQRLGGPAKPSVDGRVRLDFSH